MGKAWDKALPDKAIWQECLRLLKPGGFAFVMCIPRADCLSRMIISLEDAGFLVNFTPIFWAYASGFPKAQNIGKAVDKRLGAEGTVQICKKDGDGQLRPIPATPQAKALDGSYGGFQPKPAVEVIIVAMKPLSEKTFVDQSLKNRKGITWLDDCKIPTESDTRRIKSGWQDSGYVGGQYDSEKYNAFEARNHTGRFPANLLVSDDVLNNGRVRKSSPVGHKGVGWKHSGNTKDEMTPLRYQQEFNDSGSFSRYFDLDSWAQTLPFLIVPKASKGEKDRGLKDRPTEQVTDGRDIPPDYPSQRGQTQRHNPHPTVKPLKLMAYLITLGSREGDVILDPFMGSGTTLLAARQMGRKAIGIEIEEKYCEIAARRMSQMVMDLT